MLGKGKKQAMHDNGGKSNHICAPASTPMPPNFTGRQKHPNAVSCTCRGNSALLGLEINLAPHFIFSYAYSQVLSRKGGGGEEVSQYINLVSKGILSLHIYSTVTLECSRSTETTRV